MRGPFPICLSSMISFLWRLEEKAEIPAYRRIRSYKELVRRCASKQFQRAGDAHGHGVYLVQVVVNVATCGTDAPGVSSIASQFISRKRASAVVVVEGHVLPARL